MPTDSIYPLNPKDPITGAMDYDKKMTEFMMNKIVPDVADSRPHPIMYAAQERHTPTTSPHGIRSASSRSDVHFAAPDDSSSRIPHKRW